MLTQRWHWHWEQTSGRSTAASLYWRYSVWTAYIAPLVFRHSVICYSLESNGVLSLSILSTDVILGMGCTTSLFKMDELLWNPLLGFFSVPFFTFHFFTLVWFLGFMCILGLHRSIWCASKSDVEGMGKSNAHSRLMDTVPLGTHSTCLVDSVHCLPWCPTHRTSLWTGSPYWRPVATARPYERLQYNF